MTTRMECANCGAPLSARGQEVCQFCGFLLETDQRPALPRAATTRSSAPQRDKPWTEAEILDQLGVVSPRARSFGAQILEWAHTRDDLQVVGNTGLTYSKVALRLTRAGERDVTVASLCGAAQDFVEIPFGTLTALEPFPDPSERQRLHRDLVPLTRMAKRDPAMEKWAYADLEHLRTPEDVHQLIHILDDAINRIIASPN